MSPLSRSDWPIAATVLVALALVFLGAVGQHSADRNHSPQPQRLTRVLDTLPTGTIVVCYTHDQALACVLDPAMEGATP